MSSLARILIISTFFICQFFKSMAVDADEIKKPWTILVYLNADNSLEDAGYADLQEMEKAGSNDQVNVVVQFDGVQPEGTQRIYIEKAAEASTGHNYQSKVLEEMSEQDMGDPATLINFVTWGMKNYPAEKYMLILWNHGSGWDKSKDSRSIVKGVSYDDTSGTYINTNQLADAIDQVMTMSGNRIHVLGFDACMMDMIEVADSLNGLVDYIVGSEETEPGEGYPYDHFLKIFESKNSVSSEALARHLVKVYGQSYEAGGSQNQESDESGSDGWGDGSYPNDGSKLNVDRYGRYSEGPQVTLSAIDLSKIELVKRRLDKWLSLLQDGSRIPKADLLSAVEKTVYFSEASYKDLGDYVKNVLERVSAAADTSHSKNFLNSGIVGTSMALLKAIQAAVVENYASPSFKKAMGLSIWLPYSSHDYSDYDGKSYEGKKDEYSKLKWSQTTGWSKYLEYLEPSSNDSNSDPSLDW